MIDFEILQLIHAQSKVQARLLLVTTELAKSIPSGSRTELENRINDASSCLTEYYKLFDEELDKIDPKVS